MSGPTRGEGGLLETGAGRVEWRHIDGVVEWIIGRSLWWMVTSDAGRGALLVLWQVAHTLVDGSGAGRSGAAEALRAVARCPGVVQSVLSSGSVEDARTVLSAAGLDPHLDLTVGGFGPDAADLIGAAGERAAARYSLVFAPALTVVVADTLEGVRAGLRSDAHVVGVASETCSTEQAQAEGAHVVLPDLGTPARVIHAVLGARVRNAPSGSVTVSPRWARGLVEENLGQQPELLRHSLAAGRQAERIGHLVPEADRDLLVAAALLHDIGHAPHLMASGFAPLDAARWLQGQGAPGRLAVLVAHCSCARVEAGLRGLENDLARDFPREESLVADAVTYADMTVGPDGEVMTVEDRLEGIFAETLPGELTHSALGEAAPLLRGSVRRIEAHLARASPS